MYRLHSLLICLFTLSIFKSITLGGAIIIPKLGGGRAGGGGDSGAGDISSGGEFGGLGSTEGRPGAIGSGSDPNPGASGDGIRPGREDPDTSDDPATIAGSAAPKKTEAPDVQGPDSSSATTAVPQTSLSPAIGSLPKSTPTSQLSALSTQLTSGAIKDGLDWRLGGAVAGFVGAVGLL